MGEFRSSENFAMSIIMLTFAGILNSDYCQVRKMTANKVLFVAQEITPYVPETPMANEGHNLPHQVQTEKREVRLFMPKWGGINERRNQLHEVIRLSGMNIIINDSDHPLIIKVASVVNTRLQVYFIDNEDFFYKRGQMLDDDGKEYADNYQRAIFYARGVLETIKKTSWRPDTICCQGWMSAVVPYYVRTAYAEEPSFKDVKVIYSNYGPVPQMAPPADFKDCLAFGDAKADLPAEHGIDLTAPDALMQLAIKFSDAIVYGYEEADAHFVEMAKVSGKPLLQHTSDEDPAPYISFIDSL